MCTRGFFKVKPVNLSLKFDLKTKMLIFAYLLVGLGIGSWVPHENGDLYIFDWFEAAAAALESKMCMEIFVPHLVPSVLQRSQ